MYTSLVMSHVSNMHMTHACYYRMEIIDHESRFTMQNYRRTALNEYVYFKYTKYNFKKRGLYIHRYVNLSYMSYTYMLRL